jgi:hypothetical protein
MRGAEFSGLRLEFGQIFLDQGRDRLRGEVRENRLISEAEFPVDEGKPMYGVQDRVAMNGLRIGVAIHHLDKRSRFDPLRNPVGFRDALFVIDVNRITELSSLDPQQEGDFRVPSSGFTVVFHEIGIDDRIALEDRLERLLLEEFLGHLFEESLEGRVGGTLLASCHRTKRLPATVFISEHEEPEIGIDDFIDDADRGVIEDVRPGNARLLGRSIPLRTAVTTLVRASLVLFHRKIDCQS